MCSLWGTVKKSKHGDTSSIPATDHAGARLLWRGNRWEPIALSLWNILRCAILYCHSYHHHDQHLPPNGLSLQFVFSSEGALYVIIPYDYPQRPLFEILNIYANIYIYIIRRPNSWTKPELVFHFGIELSWWWILVLLVYSFVISDDCELKIHMKQAVINMRVKLIWFVQIYCSPSGRALSSLVNPHTHRTNRSSCSERSPFHHETTQLWDQSQEHPGPGKQERTQNPNNPSRTYLCEQVQMGRQERPEAHGEGGEGELWLQVNRGRQESAWTCAFWEETFWTSEKHQVQVSGRRPR